MGALQVMATVGQVEGLIDEREIGDDVANDRVLEYGPVLPRGIVRVATPDSPDRTGFERDPDRSPPALDQTRTARAVGGHAYMRAVRSARKHPENMLNQTTRFLHLIESNRNARRNVPVGANSRLN